MRRETTLSKSRWYLLCSTNSSFLQMYFLCRVVVVAAVRKADCDTLGWAIRIFDRFTGLWPSQLQCNMVLVPAILIFFSGTCPVLHSDFPRTILTYFWYIYQTLFLWRTCQCQHNCMLVDMFFLSALYLPVEHFDNHPLPCP